MKKIFLQRGCAEDPKYGLTISPGQSGTGVYFFSPSAKMQQYYTANGESLVTAKVKSDANFIDFTVKDNRDQLLTYMRSEIDKQGDNGMGSFYQKPKITLKNYQCFGQLIEMFVGATGKGVDGYLVNHEGDGIPKGKQAVIRNIEAIEIMPIKDKNINTGIEFN
jgi:hypothetical protein